MSGGALVPLENQQSTELSGDTTIHSQEEGCLYVCASGINSGSENTYCLCTQACACLNA